jgi:hypothetical protein
MAAMAATYRKASRNDGCGRVAKALDVPTIRGPAACSRIGPEGAFDLRVAGSNPARPTHVAAVQKAFHAPGGARRSPWPRIGPASATISKG